MVEKSLEKTRRQKGEGTYTTFAHAHRLGTPFVVNGALELEEPRVCQVPKPPVGRMVHSDLPPQHQ